MHGAVLGLAVRRHFHMGEMRWGELVHWTALLVLLTIGIGFCDCLEDTVGPLGPPDFTSFSTDSPVPDATECSANCDTCICCALLLVPGKTDFKPSPIVSNAVAQVVLSPANPDPARMKRPPRA